MGELERLRRRQTTRVPLILLSTAPLAVAYTALHLERWLLAAVAGALGLVIGVAAGWKVARPGVTNYGYQAGDHPPHRAWLPFVAPTVALIAGPFLPELTAQPGAGPAVGYAVLTTLALAAGWRATETEYYRVGKRRIRRLLATDDALREVTVGRLELAEKHRWLLITLTSMGAVDGARAWVWKIARLTGATPEAVVEVGRELRQAGLIGLTPYPAGREDSNMGMWLTGTGVRVLAESGRR